MLGETHREIFDGMTGWDLVTGEVDYQACHPMMVSGEYSAALESPEGSLGTLRFGDIPVVMVTERGLRVSCGVGVVVHPAHRSRWVI